PASPEQRAEAVAMDPGFADALAERRRAIRAVVSRRMAESAAVPQFTVFADIDLEALDRARDGVGWTGLWARGLAHVVRRHPVLNQLWQRDQAQPQEHVGVSLAVDTPVGLMAPVVGDPDLLDVRELDAELRRTVDRARTGRLTAA